MSFCKQLQYHILSGISNFRSQIGLHGVEGYQCRIVETFLYNFSPKQHKAGRNPYLADTVIKGAAGPKQLCGQALCLDHGQLERVAQEGGVKVGVYSPARHPAHAQVQRLI